MTYSFLLSLVFIIGINGSSTGLLNRLRKEKTIVLQAKLSSPMEIHLQGNNQLNITCSFLSNFDQLDLFWLHNGTLIQSFLSKSISKEEEDSFLGVSIVSTIWIRNIHFDMNGFYQCIAVQQEIYAQQTFDVHLHSNSSIKTNFSLDALITVHTAQALFEPRRSVSLMCRVNNQCTIQWFDRNDEILNPLGETTDLILQNATFDDQMGLYYCQICCANQCYKLSSFVYPAAAQMK